MEIFINQLVQSGLFRIQTYLSVVSSLLVVDFHELSLERLSWKAELRYRASLFHQIPRGHKTPTRLKIE